MATLTIRNVDSVTKEQLRVRAAQNGRSMEAELRCILSGALETDAAGEPNLAESIRRRMAPLGGVDLVEHPSMTLRAPPAFDGA